MLVAIQIVVIQHYSIPTEETQAWIDRNIKKCLNLGGLQRILANQEIMKNDDESRL